MASNNSNFSNALNELKCIICDAILSIDDDWLRTTCHHSFHKECIKGWLHASHECPQCRKILHLCDLQCPDKKDKAKTLKKYRQKNKISDQVDQPSEIQNNSIVIVPNSSSQDNIEIVPSDDSDEEDNDNRQGNNLQTQQMQSTMNEDKSTQSSVVDYKVIQKMIDESFQKIMSNLTLKESKSNSENEIQPKQVNDQNITFDYNNENSQNRTFRNFALSPEKITNIIQNWHLKFDGSSNGMRCSEFIYRVKALTKECLNDNFYAICNNLNILLAGKAKEWYWRYHKEVQYIEWQQFCSALMHQFKDLKSDSDIREDLTKCKQRPNESFESFFDRLISIADQLTIPLSESDLIERVTRNLDDDVRHELLFVPIHSITQLRKLCQKRENFFNEKANKASYNRNNFGSRKNISVLNHDSEVNVNNENVSQSLPEVSIDAIQKPRYEITCFNCDEPGHRWDMCLSDRKIFCYGCGAKNVYKPQCLVCSKKAENLQKGPFSNGRMEPK